MSEKSTITYFAKDGNYGAAEGLIIVNNNEWDEATWKAIETMNDNERYLFVDHHSNK